MSLSRTGPNLTTILATLSRILWPTFSLDREVQSLQRETLEKELAVHNLHQ